ncbi:MAG: hypothetical protein M1837_004235 [Sclerophora amabilis]|nr:MAG: hypothetical protein M1837_004235 [Sclerophora amabilis]
MGKLNYTNRKVEGLKLGQIVCKDLVKRIPPGAGSKAALRDPVIELNISHRNLTDEGAFEIVSGLTKSLCRDRENEQPITRLEELCLSGNQLTARCLAPLSQVIEIAADDLRDLDLSENNICVASEDEAVAWETFLRSFRRCSVLRRFDLSRNALGPRAFEIFARVYTQEENIGLGAAHEEGYDGDCPTPTEPSPRDGEDQDATRRGVQALDLGPGEGEQTAVAANGPVGRKNSPKADRQASSPYPAFKQSRATTVHDATRYSVTEGLRSVPYIILANTSMTDACALHLSFVLPDHHLPETLLAFVPPARPGLASHQLDTYDSLSGCQGLVYLGNDGLSTIGMQILAQCEKARDKLLNRAEDDVQVSGGSKTSPSRQVSSTRSSSENGSSRFASRPPRRHRSDPSGESFEIGPNSAAVNGTQGGILERMRKKIQVNTIKDSGLHSVELWSTAFQFLKLARSVMLKILPPPPPSPRHDTELGTTNGDDSYPVSTNTAATPPPEISATEPVYTSHLAVEEWPSLVPKTPPSTSRGQKSRQLSESSGSKGAASRGGSSIHDSPVLLLKSEFTKLPNKLSLLGGLPGELWHRIIREIMDPHAILNQDQQRAILAFAWSRDSLSRERELAGKSESAQIWHLSKEDENASGGGGAENEVRREDQDKINKFSRLHQREIVLEEQRKAKNKDKEDLEEVSNELELADEDDSVPYKIGDTFFALPLPEAQSLLSSSTTGIEEEIGTLEEKLGGVREEMQELKVALYARFGRSINLET